MLDKYTDGMKRSNSSKGVTPVIAVLLLLMMTVAAAGGAYVWMNSLQEDLREQTEQEAKSFDRDISMSDLKCYNEEGTGKINVLFKNSGTKALDLNPVDMEVRSLGEFIPELSRYDISLSETSIDTGDSSAEGISLDPSVDSDFADVNGVGYYTIEVGSGTFDSGRYYTIEFTFKDEGDYTKEARCQVD